MSISTDQSDNFKSRYPDHTFPSASVGVAFLLEIASHGPMTVVTVPVGGSGARSQTYDTANPGDVESMRSFIAFHETQPSQVFYLPGVAQSKLTQVPGRDDMVSMRSLVLDFDPDKDKTLEQERDRLRAVAHQLIIGPIQPRAIIDTGGGMQVVYQLLEPVPVTPDSILEIEALMKALSRAMGADTATCTVKNLFRVPGTWNWPTAAKKRAGRERTVSGVWHCGGPRTSLTDLRALATVLPEDIDPIDVDFGGVTEHDVIAVLGEPDALPAHIIDAIRLEPGIQAANARPNPAAVGQRSTQDEQLCYVLAHFSIPPGDIALILAAYGAKVHEAHQQERLFGYVIGTVKRALRDASPDRLFKDLGTEAEKQEYAAQHKQHLERLKPLTVDQLITGIYDDTTVSLVERMMGRREVTVIYGRSGAGKTFVALDLTYRISLGMEWNGHKTLKMAVVYIAAESMFNIRYRVDALVQKFGKSDLFYMITSRVNLFDPNADLKPLVENLRALGVDIGVIVIDTLARAMAGGNENSTQDMGRLVTHGDMLRDHFNANVIWIHHTGKDESNGARGSSALQAATDVELEVRANKIASTKMRDHEDIEYGFQLASTKVGTKVSGEEVFTCTVEWSRVNAGLSLRQRTPRNEAIRIVMEIIRHHERDWLTLQEIIHEAQAQGIRIPLTQQNLGRVINRSVESDTERFLVKRFTDQKARGNNYIPEYGLANP